MQRTRIPPLILSLPVWLDQMGIPPLTLQRIIAMRSGDEIRLFDYLGPGLSTEAGHAFAVMRRIVGGYAFEAHWSLRVGDADRRGRLQASGSFIMLTGKRIEIRGNPKETALGAPRVPLAMGRYSRREITAFTRIVRLSGVLSKIAAAAGDKMASRRMAPRAFTRNDRRFGLRVGFLDRLVRVPISH